MTPDNGLRSISACNGEFNYQGTSIGRIKLRIRYNNAAPSNREEKPNNNKERLYPQRAYHRGSKRRASDSIAPTIIDNFSIITSPTSPNINQRTDVTIRARNGNTTNTQYRGTITFSVERKLWSSWITASSSLYNIARTSYTFTPWDNGQKTLSNLIRFTNQNYDYRLIIQDNNNTIQGIKNFSFERNVYDDNYSTNNFLLSTNNSSPNIEQRVNLGIRAREGTNTNTNYRGSVDFDVYYKAVASSARVKTTSSTYYTMHSSYRNGYTFGSSQNGNITIVNFIKFNRDNHSYKVLVYDKNNESIVGERIFTVGNTNNIPSTIAWFSTTELSTLTQIYNSRDTTISNLKSTYPKLRTNTRWANTSNTFKKDMKDVIDNKSTRKFRTYISFSNNYITRRRYTNSIK